jgi:hypothetical protein
LIRPISDGSVDPVERQGVVSPGFEGSSPSEVVRQVLRGDAVEAVEPLLQAAVVGVDVIDVQMRRLGRRLSRRRHGVEGNAGPAGEAGDWKAAVADQMIDGRNDPGKRRANGGAGDLRQDRIEGCALPVARDQDGNAVLISTRMPGLAAPLAKPRAEGPTVGL